MMAMVEEGVMEMGTTGGGVTTPGAVIVSANMPEDLAEETEQERWENGREDKEEALPNCIGL